MQREKKANMFVQIVDKTILFKPKGDVGVYECEEISQILKKNKEKKIINSIFDFEETTFIDSTLIGIILQLYRELKIYDGSVMVINAKNQVEKILRRTGVTEIIKNS